MKKYLFVLMLALGTISLAANDAEAKRLGGGSSFGKQSQSLGRPAPSQPSQAASQARPAPPAAVPPKPASPWRGMLGGALLGLGLGAMLSHFGLGGAIGSMISTLLMVGLLAAAAYFIYRMFRAKSNNGVNNKPSFAGAFEPGARSGTPEIGSNVEPVARTSTLESMPLSTGTTGSSWGIPADFDVPSFLRNAKTYFIRLQAAWDKADINDIREFTSPEMFGELRLQIQERGASPNNTDVVTLDAELMGVETVGDEYLASVKFSGMIKESDAAPAAPFAEVWNLSKPTSGQGGWILAGIQQLS